MHFGLARSAIGSSMIFNRAAHGRAARRASERGPFFTASERFTASVTGQVFTAFRADCGAFQAIFPGKGGQL
jgi:hypothetical protein